MMMILILPIIQDAFRQDEEASVSSTGGGGEKEASVSGGKEASVSSTGGGGDGGTDNSVGGTDNSVRGGGTDGTDSVGSGTDGTDSVCDGGTGTGTDSVGGTDSVHSGTEQRMMTKMMTEQSKMMTMMTTMMTMIGELGKKVDEVKNEMHTQHNTVIASIESGAQSVDTLHWKVMSMTSNNPLLLDGLDMSSDPWATFQEWGLRIDLIEKLFMALQTSQIPLSELYNNDDWPPPWPLSFVEEWTMSNRIIYQAVIRIMKGGLEYYQQIHDADHNKWEN